MDTRELQVFLSVAYTLNFGRSGAYLHMSVSAVSRSIQRLEGEVGRSLFERDKRQVRLTAAGREFRRYAQHTLDEWQRIKHQLGDGAGLSGEVSLYCSVTASYSVLAPVLEAFRSAQPRVEIKLHTGDPADGIDRVLAGQHDIAVTGRPDQLPRRLAFLPLQESPMVFCMPAADCAVRSQVLAGDSASPDFAWESLPFIVPERGVTRDMLDAWFADRGGAASVYAQVAGHEAVVAMVGLGLGVGIAPELVIRTGGMAQRVTLLRAWKPLPPLGIGLCAPRQSLADPLVRSFWEVAATTFGAAV